MYQYATYLVVMTVKSNYLITYLGACRLLVAVSGCPGRCSRVSGCFVAPKQAQLGAIRP